MRLIADEAAIGAGAVVIVDVPSFSISARVPAPALRKCSERPIDALRELEWWNWPIEAIGGNQDLIYAAQIDGSTIKTRSRS